ncbi:MAG: alpha/beta hydrolase [Myxococcota bacterium]
MGERDLPVDDRGLALRLCEWGAVDTHLAGRPVVILHGFLEQGAAWDRVARGLGRWVVAPDQRGHGRSGHVGAGGWYHFWDYVGDLDALVAHVRASSGGAPVDLVGHSMGGTVAALFAGARPEAVRRLVLVEGLGPPDTTDTAVDRARQYLDHRRRPPVHGPLRDAADGAARIRKFNPEIPEAVADALAERITAPDGDGVRWTWDPLHRGRAPNPFEAAIFVRFLREITAPTLVIDGGRTSFVVADAPERAAAIRDARRVVIPDAGHLVHHDAPDALADEIRRFLEET